MTRPEPIVVPVVPDFSDAQYGWDVYTHTEVVPKTAPPEPVEVQWVWHIGSITSKTEQPTPTGNTAQPGRISLTMQLTADQQVDLSISGEDAYNNPVDISGDVTWLSSDESIVIVEGRSDDVSKATAKAVGPAGTAAVTVTNDADRDGTGDFMGSLAIDVVAGTIAEIVIEPGTPYGKLDINPNA